MADKLEGLSALARSIDAMNRNITGLRDDLKKGSAAQVKATAGTGTASKGNAGAAIGQALAASRSAGAAGGAGAVAGLAGAAGGAVASAVAAAVKEAVGSLAAAQSKGTAAVQNASGLEDASTVGARADFAEQSARRPELLKGAGRLASNIPVFGSLIQGKFDRAAAEEEFATRQATAPALAALQDAKSRTSAILEPYARATGKPPSEDVIRMLMRQQQPGAEAVVATQQLVNKAFGAREQELYKLPQFQARAMTFGG